MCDPKYGVVLGNVREHLTPLLSWNLEKEEDYKDLLGEANHLELKSDEDQYPMSSLTHLGHKDISMG